MRNLVLVSILLFSLSEGRLNAQDSLGWQRNQVIGINFQKRTLEPSYLPFDVPYRLYVVAPDSLGIDSVRIRCFQVSGKFNKKDILSDQHLQWTNDTLSSILV